MCLACSTWDTPPCDLCIMTLYASMEYRKIQINPIGIIHVLRNGLGLKLHECSNYRHDSNIERKQSVFFLSSTSGFSTGGGSFYFYGSGAKHRVPLLHNGRDLTELVWFEFQSYSRLFDYIFLTKKQCNFLSKRCLHKIIFLFIDL